ncbi:MAG TPA: hypothetical protein VG105_02720 [Paraburkholderia sp.]|jgi:hypothetical protein|nr:hypothetical protein [Paraburkholderia sp.]
MGPLQLAIGPHRHSEALPKGKLSATSRAAFRLPARADAVVAAVLAGRPQIFVHLLCRAPLTLRSSSIGDYAVTQQTLIEQLVVAEEERILAGIEPDSAQWRAHFIDTSLRGSDGDQINEKFPNDNNEGAHDRTSCLTLSSEVRFVCNVF